MSVDRNNRSHRPGGLPKGYAGTFAPGSDGTCAPDVRPPANDTRRRTRTAEDDERAWALKSRIERLAADGDRGQADRLAREAGAYVAGDSLPYGSGYCALFDGRELNTVEIRGGMVTLAPFMPETIRA
ncbi:hypothetical protein [Bifidobacterium breve]|uniref:hypothetical protein n=1 Tax=Bifidobacterium breve TaxID=1685 RepID=UPI0034A24F47